MNITSVEMDKPAFSFSLFCCDPPATFHLLCFPPQVNLVMILEEETTQIYPSTSPPLIHLAHILFKL